MAAINQIQKTNDYSMFKVLGGNRVVDTKHVNRLVEQIEMNGNITEVSPIIVNEKFEVIDGQHRLKAAEKTGVPVGYLVQPGLVVSDALQMNITSKTWKPNDYLNLYVQQGLRPYLKFADILDNHSWCTVTILLMIISGGEVSGKLKRFKQGDLDDFNFNEIEERVQYIEDIARINPIFIQGRMIKALLNALSSPGFVPQRFYSNFKGTGGLFRAQLMWFENVQPIIDIHNRDVKTV